LGYRSYNQEGRTHEIRKIKGLTLNYKSSLILNFNNIKKLIIENKRERREAKEETERSMINLRFTGIRRTAFHEIVTRRKSVMCAYIDKM